MASSIITGSVDKGFTVTNTYSPKVKGVPKTGDDFNLVLYPALILGAGGLFLYLRKKKIDGK